MRKYLIRRIIQSALLIVFMLFLNFLILRLTPGDPLTTFMYGGKPLTSRQQYYAAEMEKRMGIYTDPLPVAFLNWGSGVLRFDFGYSIQDGKPITPQLVNAAVGSFWLLLISLLIGAGTGIPLGIYAAYRVGTWKDKFVQVFSVVFTTLPGWFMFLFAQYLNQWIWTLTNKKFSIIPVFTLDQTLDPFVLQLGVFWNLFLPIFFMATIFLALFAGQARSQVLEVLHQDYVRTARAKGLPSRKILLVHILKNSISPLIILLGGIVPLTFGSQILIETVSYWNGLGSLFLQAASTREYTILNGSFYLFSNCIGRV